MRRLLASMWHLLLAVLLLSALSGCSLITKTVYVEPKFVYIEFKRPTFDTSTPLSPRALTLARYAAGLEDKIRKYNKWAQKKNIANKYEDPKPPRPAPLNPEPVTPPNTP